MEEKLEETEGKDNSKSHPEKKGVTIEFWKISKRCFHCGLSAMVMKRCGGCKIAQYCSPECQKSNWTTHKNDCKNLTNESTRLKELQEIAHDKAFRAFAKIFQHGPLSQFVDVDSKFSAWIRRVPISPLKVAFKLCNGKMDYFIGNLPKKRYEALDDTKILSTIEEVQALQKIDFSGKTFFADLPLRQFVGVTGEGLYCSDDCDEEIQTVVKILIDGVANTIKKQGTPPVIVMLLPYLPRTKWYWTLTELKATMAYVKDDLECSSILKLTMDVQEEHRKEFSVPMRSFLPYQPVMFYIGIEISPFQPLPPFLTMELNDLLLEQETK